MAASGWLVCYIAGILYHFVHQLAVLGAHLTYSLFFSIAPPGPCNNKRFLQATHQEMFNQQLLKLDKSFFKLEYIYSIYIGIEINSIAQWVQVKQTLRQIHLDNISTITTPNTWCIKKWMKVYLWSYYWGAQSRCLSLCCLLVDLVDLLPSPILTQMHSLDPQIHGYMQWNSVLIKFDTLLLDKVRKGCWVFHKANIFWNSLARSWWPAIKYLECFFQDWHMCIFQRLTMPSPSWTTSLLAKMFNPCHNRTLSTAVCHPLWNNANCGTLGSNTIPSLKWHG